MTPSILRPLHFVVPGPLSTLTGGFVYDRRIVEALRAEGVEVEVIELAGPEPTPEERAHIAAVPDSCPILFDGLSLPHLPELLSQLPHRSLALVHHPCSLEPNVADRGRVAAAERAALAEVSGVITTSAHTARMLADLGVDPASARVVHPATDPVPVGEPPHNPRPRLVCVATLTHRKGHDLLLDAVRGLDVEVECIGSAAHEPTWAREVTERARALPPPTRVRLMGSLEQHEVDAALDRADLFVFPSRYEGFGMAPLEAIRRGLPVLATRVGALPEALEGGAAHLVAPNEVALRKGLEHCLRPEVRPEMRARARAVAGDLPTWRDAGRAFRDALRAMGAVR